MRGLFYVVGLILGGAAGGALGHALEWWSLIIAIPLSFAYGVGLRACADWWGL